MNNYLIEKLKEGRLNKGLKQSDVTKLIGIKNTTLSNYENGNTEPDMDTFLKLCQLYDLNYSDLLGEAYGYKVPGFSFDVKPSDIEFLKKYRDLDDHGKKIVDFILEEEHGRSRRNIIPLEHRRSRLVQYYQRFASAGSGQLVFDDVPVDLIEIPDVPEYKDVKYAIGVNGRSMEPLYYDGDILLVKPADDVAVGDIGIFIVDGQSYVKKRGHDCLISVNEEYADIPLDESSSCLGEVVDKLKK